jgi:hypothetical protein
MTPSWKLQGMAAGKAPHPSWKPQGKATRARKTWLAKKAGTSRRCPKEPEDAKKVRRPLFPLLPAVFHPV